MKLNDGYILGLIEGEGSFTFSTNKYITANSDFFVRKVPAFMLQMHERDAALVNAVRDYLRLPNRVYIFRQPTLITNKKIYKRGNTAMLTVREIGSLKNIIMPFFAGRLVGYKGMQFREWIEAIENDPGVPDSYRIIARIYRYRFDK